MRAVVVALFVSLTLGRPARAAADLAAQLDAEVAAHFRADQPGAAVLVRKGNQVLLRKGYGMADLRRPQPLQPQMVFRLGSITKQFTATAIMMLVDAGKVSLGDDVRKWVPQFPAKGPPITIEHLLTHTSGVPSYTDQPGFRERSHQDLTHAQLLATIKDLPLDFPPGARWKYSNSGYYLLGLVIEKATGRSYAQFVTDKIFGPLGMSHSGYGTADPVLPGGVRGYEGPRRGAAAASANQAREAEIISMKPPFAAGALVSTVDDLALWDQAIAAGKLLSKASWQRVFSPFKLTDGTLTNYGCGWFLSSYEGHRAQGHGGGIPGFNTTILRLPDDQVLVVILSNSDPAPIELTPLALKLAALTIGKPIVDPPVVKVAPEVLDEYAGVYLLGGKRRALVRRSDDHLSVQPGGGPPIEALPASSDSFFVTGTIARFTFARELKSGRVIGMDVRRPDGSTDHADRSDEPLPAQRASVTVDPAVLERYVGDYQLGPGFVLSITREGAHLFAQATHQPRFEIFASSPTDFFLKVVDAQLTFSAAGTGPAKQVVLHQNGHDVPGKRVR